MTHYDPRDHGQDDDDLPTPLEVWFLRIVVCGAAAGALLLVVLALWLMFGSRDAAAGDLLIVDQNCQVVRYCALPTDYIPGAQALMCKTTDKVFVGGFEAGCEP